MSCSNWLLDNLFLVKEDFVMVAIFSLRVLHLSDSADVVLDKNLFYDINAINQ
jgi:hypothetical protein